MRKGYVQKISLYALLILLVAFPKGGILISNIPLSWGYFLIIFLSPLIPIRCIELLFRMRVNRFKFILSLLILPFQLYLLISFYGAGVFSIGFAFSMLANFVVLPWLLLSGTALTFSKSDIINLLKLFIYSIRFIVIFGIINFLFKHQFDYFLDIPGITSILGSEVNLESKFNDRGGIFKLFSTYANGNIYGVCALMMLPLYNMFEKNKLYVNLFKLTICLTLSRTAWIGLIIYEILNYIFSGQYNYKTMKKLLLIFSFIILSIICLSTIMEWDVNILFDTELGGRANPFLQFQNASLFSNQPFGGIGEIVYPSVAEQLGWIGLILFIIFMTSPILITLLPSVIKSDPYISVLRISLILYLILCFSDGAIQFIPVMSIYWGISYFLLMRLLYLNKPT